MENKRSHGFGTAPVFFTAISTILGAILFLRFGFAVGTLGFTGVLAIILLGHLVTIPTALAISEISTNQRVEGGGEYFIISRSFGLNIGATIGLALYFSQAISVAFYVIAFTEAFEPFFDWMRNAHGIDLPKQAISLPAMAILSALILIRGANIGVKALIVIVIILAGTLVLFFAGTTEYASESGYQLFSGSFRNSNQFFIVFAIVFPAFTGMTDGVGLSGDLKSPRKSIPRGTLMATFIGMIAYVFIAWKLTVSASPEDLAGEQLVMSKIAVWGIWVIPIGLAASTISSAIGSVMVAPRTLQALSYDNLFPLPRVNRFLSKGKKADNEPFNASLITVLIAFVFVTVGNINMVAEIISMFFMVTYGALCLISFLNHWGSDPSYRPTFRSRWYISLVGFLMSVWLMFKINWIYAFVAIAAMILIYMIISRYHKERRGLQSIFRGAIIQLNRRLQVYLQKSTRIKKSEEWRPAAVCISSASFIREEAFYLLEWIAHKYGFGTYIHLIEGYYSRQTHEEAQQMLDKLIEKTEQRKNNVYIDTLISPSYTSAIAQTIQLPGISGMDNNMMIFEFDKTKIGEIEQIIDNFKLVKAGNYDICILGSSHKRFNFKKGIHVWIRSFDYQNSNLMILLSYIITGHPDWQKGGIKIFDICKEEELEQTRENLLELVKTGRIPITEKNIQIIKKDENVSSKVLISEHSAEAGLTIIGFRAEHIKHYGTDLFMGYDVIGDMLFVNSHRQKEIT
ncbi:MAG: amino acid permease [Bacteroidetes bacterium]|nr:MAG: amino acid permease [Bacteroidota bacterium]